MKGRDIKDKMDFWGRAKNKGNKSADHEGMTRLVSAEGAGRKGPGDNSTPGQMTCWRIEKSTQEVSSQFTKPTRAGWLSAGPWSARGGRTITAHSFSPSNFPSQIFPCFGKQLGKGQRRTGVTALVCTHQTETKPNLIKAWWVPLPQLPFWSVGCLCVWSVSVCAPTHNYATA